MENSKSPYGSLKFNSIDEYHAFQTPKIQLKLQELREIIKEILVDCEEVISYNMPAFKKKKVVVYYAANKNHIGFYPTPSPIIEFQKELLSYKTSKGAIQFPLNEPFPKELIQRIIMFRAEQVY
jgi:uncharacterized protein YdhG (YjbR/CyaY superfamily)